MVTPRPPCHALALVLVLAALPACASAPTSSKVAGASEPLPGDMNQTIALLDRAEADLTSALGPERREGAPEAQAERPAADAAAATPPPPPPAVAQDDKDKKKELPADHPAATAAEESAPSPVAVQTSPCATACRALESMRRAAEHLCNLAGEGDSRCGAARGRVQRASERVRETCPPCGE